MQATAKRQKLAFDFAVAPELEPLLERHPDHVVLHAPQDCRLLETAICVAIRAAIAGEEVAIVTNSSARAAHLLRSWLRTSRLLSPGSSRSVGAVVGYEVADAGTVWLLPGDVSKDLPFLRADRLIALDCHARARDPRSLADFGTWMLAGEFPEREHWLYQAMERAGFLTRLPAAAIEKAFPDQRGRGLGPREPYYERKMLLADVEPKLNASNFTAFTRRLWISTDRPPDRLTAEQRAAMHGQYGTPILPFRLSRLQKRYLAAKRRAIAMGRKPWFILLKYRRGGFTTLEQALSYRMCVTRPNSQVMTLADTQPKTARTFRMVDTFHRRDPQALKLLTDTKGELGFENGSLFFIGTAGAQSSGRGDTLQRVHGHEVAYWCDGPNQREDVDQLWSGFSNAAGFGEIVLESTPNGVEWFCQEYRKAKRGENELTPIFVAWFDDELNRLAPGEFSEAEIRDTLAESEKDLIARHGLTTAQIAWRRMMQKRNGVLASQENPDDDETCFLSSGHCFFDVQLMLAVRNRLTDKSAPKPVSVREVPGGVIVHMHEPVKGRRYCAGADTSEGLLGGDPNGWGIIDQVTGEQVAWGHGKFPPRQLAELSVAECKVYNNALLGVERENHGHAVLLKIEDLKYDRPHFRGGPLFYFHEGAAIDKARPGWTTNSETRHIAITELRDSLADAPHNVHDPDFALECLSFRKQSSGKYEHDPGEHDDRVMKWAIAQQMRKRYAPAPRVTTLATIEAARHKAAAAAAKESKP